MPMNAALSLTVRPQLRADCGLERVGGRWLAASADDTLHSFVNGDGEVSVVAERIVELVDGKRTIDDIVSVLCAEFDVPVHVCRADTLRFVSELVRKNLFSILQ